MGSQQILLLVLTVIVVGVAITAGIGQYKSQQTSFHRDEMVNHMEMINQLAIKHYYTPKELGGGWDGGADWTNTAGGDFSGFVIPVELQTNDNAWYIIGESNRLQFTLQATSKTDGQPHGMNPTITSTFWPAPIGGSNSGADTSAWVFDGW